MAAGLEGASYCLASVMERSTSERREGEKVSALFTILCSEPVSWASLHCRGNHLVRLTGVARAIKQRARLLGLVSSLEKSERGLEREILCHW